MLAAAQMQAAARAQVAAHVSDRRISRAVLTRGRRTQAASVGEPSTADDNQEEVPTSSDVQLACPVCLRPFRGTSRACVGCGRSFPVDGGVINLCLDAGGASGAYKEPPAKSGTRLFQSELISSAYENGWRQSFAWAGFPGEEAESAIAMEYMEKAGATGGVVLDVSCGSGLFSRRFAASGKFAKVVASDFSDAMMRQTKSYCDQDAKLRAKAEGLEPSLLFVRADVGRLPFATGSIDAVHAGAAMHCWPSPSAAVAEISRVLKPGGVFLASTFLDPTAMLGDVAGGDAAVAPLSALFKDSGVGTGGAFNQFFSEPELRDLTTKMCGFENFVRARDRQFIFFSATRPR